MRKILIGVLLLSQTSYASLFGEENIALAKLVIGQIQEINQLAESIGIAKEHVELLQQLNEGINQVTRQVEAIDEVISRAQGLDPRSVKNISDLRNLVENARSFRNQTQEVIAFKLAAANEAVEQGGAQAETAYTMGQEMVKVGAGLSREAHTASPGRAAQINAAASANTMLSNGVQLQTLAQIAQMQAVALELQRSQMERDLDGEKARSSLYFSALQNQQGTKAPKAGRRL